MSRRRNGKKKAEEGALSAAGDDEPPRKSLKTKGNNKSPDPIPVCYLSNNRKVTINWWMGKALVDIREFFVNKEGKEQPGKRGVSLTMDEWNKMRDCSDEIEKKIGDKNN